MFVCGLCVLYVCTDKIERERNWKKKIRRGTQNEPRRHDTNDDIISEARRIYADCERNANRNNITKIDHRPTYGYHVFTDNIRIKTQFMAYNNTTLESVVLWLYDLNTCVIIVPIIIGIPFANRLVSGCAREPKFGS